MRADGTFDVASFTPTDVTAEPAVTTALPVGVVTMLKNYEGQVSGRSTTIFTAAFDQTFGSGTYIALESFEGSLDGRSGTFNFWHSATTVGENRSEEFFRVVMSSGTGDLSSIRGGGGLVVDADGTHRIWFDYDLD